MYFFMGCLRMKSPAPLRLRAILRLLKRKFHAKKSQMHLRAKQARGHTRRGA